MRAALRGLGRPHRAAGRRRHGRATLLGLDQPPPGRARTLSSSSRWRRPVVFWGGWPLLRRGWYSLVHRSLNMFTLVALGVLVAFGYSAAVTLAPEVVPGRVPRTPRGIGRRLLRGGGRDRHAGAARPGPRGRRPRKRTGDALRRSCCAGAARGAPRGRRRDRTRTSRSTDVRSGDRLRVRPGERVPVDGVVRRGHDRGRRVDAHGRAHAGREAGRATRVAGGTLNGAGSVVLRGDARSAPTRCSRASWRAWARRSAAGAASSAWPTRVAAWFVPAVLAAGGGRRSRPGSSSAPSRASPTRSSPRSPC